MLTIIRPTSRAAVAAACLLAFVFAGLTFAAPRASAAQECNWVDGSLVCTEVTETETPGTEGTDGGSNGGSSEPTCDLRPVDSGYDNPSAPFCDGEDVCFNVDHFAPLKMPEGEKPEEDSKARVTLCYDGIMGPPGVRRVFWSGQEDEPPSLLVQVQTAIAQLQIPTPTVGVSPAGRTLVNLDTWFWLQGAQADVSASAFTVTVTARLARMTVDPGDGSGTFACDPVPTTAAEAEASCIHEYRKASVRGSASVSGRPAYGVTVTSVYDLTFTAGGNTIEVPGAPGTLDGPPATGAVRVDEVQTVTRPNR